jgi:hypothetical protein
MCQSSSFCCRLQTIAVLVPSMMSSCGRRCRSRAFAVCFSAVAVECFRNYGGFCPFDPVLLLFLSMLRMCQSSSFCCRSQTIAVLVPSMVSSCGRRCRSRAVAVLLGCRCRMLSQLWRLLSLCSCAVAIFVDVEDVSVFKLSLSFANCRCPCAVDGVVVRPLLSFACGRCASRLSLSNAFATMEASVPLLLCCCYFCRC